MLKFHSIPTAVQKTSKFYCKVATSGMCTNLIRYDHTVFAQINKKCHIGAVAFDISNHLLLIKVFKEAVSRDFFIS